MTEAERAYLAGFFDGEGNVHAAITTGRNVQFILTVTNTSLAVLEELRQCSGGLGTITANPHPKGSPTTWATRYNWRIGSKHDLFTFIDAVLPYSRLKRGKLLLVAEGLALPGGRLRNPAAHERRLAIREQLLVR